MESAGVTRYFYDFEFIEDGSTIEPISIGIVSSDGREYYAIVEEISHEHAPLYQRLVRHRWLMENVISKLPLLSNSNTGKPRITMPTNVSPQNPGFSLDLEHPAVLPHRIIVKQVKAFLYEAPGDIELWGYYSAYDHVALMQLWGTMMARPERLPMRTRDLKELGDHLGIARDRWPAQTGEHDALADARWNRDVWSFLQDAQE